MYTEHGGAIDLSFYCNEGVHFFKPTSRCCTFRVKYSGCILIMITHKTLQMKLVGVLLVTFSILFPLLKIAASLGHYYNYHNARDNPVIRFFVFSSGKWSMADVMVVAIFMAYVGFNGIISSQFGKLKAASEEVVVLTTNATSLQPGFYLFLTYTLLALFLSGFLTRKPPA